MDEQDAVREAVESLQQLGLEEYEAKSFVALSRLGQGTAKETSGSRPTPSSAPGRRTGW